MRAVEEKIHTAVWQMARRTSHQRVQKCICSEIVQEWGIVGVGWHASWHV